MRDKRILKNAGWIIVCKIIQALLGLVITMFSARYLGPSGYGLINYAASVVAFFVPFMQLGLNATLVQEIINRPDQEGEVLGTALTLTTLSSVACITGIAAFAGMTNPTETTTVVVCILYSISLLSQSLEMIQYWFQAKLLSKYTALAMLVSYALVSTYKIVLLIRGSHIYWFALAQAIDYAIIAITLFVIFWRKSCLKLSFSKTLASNMLHNSKHYILSSLMVTIFAQTDKIMLKMMLDESAVGIYSAAVTCASMSSFIFVAIIDSARPAIFQSKKISEQKFSNNLTALYSVIIYLSLIFCLAISVCAELVVHILYGDAYVETSSVLRIVVWYTTFSYLGSVRNIWILARKKQKYLWVINLSGALLNVMLNILMIPRFSVHGAAVASLITQLFSNFLLGFVIKPLRGNNKMLLDSLNIKRYVLLWIKNKSGT